MFGKKLCGAFLLGMALASGKLIGNKMINKEDSIESTINSLTKGTSKDQDHTNQVSHEAKQHQETPIVINPKKNEPQVKELFESFATFDTKNNKKNQKQSEKQNLPSDGKNPQEQCENSEQNHEESQCVDPDVHKKLDESKFAGKTTTKQQKVKQAQRKVDNIDKKMEPKHKFNIGNIQMVAQKGIKKQYIPENNLGLNKKVTTSVKLPNLPKLLKIEKPRKEVSWVYQNTEEPDAPKDGKDKYTRVQPQTNNDLGSIRKLDLEGKHNLRESEKQDKKQQFLYEIDFQNPRVSQTLLSRNPVDEFLPPIQICVGSTMTNRLTSQFASLKTSGVSEIERKVFLQPGPYKIRFDWESNESGGEIQVFWNHRIVGSFKSFDTNVRKEMVHVEGLKCLDGKNTLKFVVSGPIPVGIDNIQINN